MDSKKKKKKMGNPKNKWKNKISFLWIWYLWCLWVHSHVVYQKTLEQLVCFLHKKLKAPSLSSTMECKDKWMGSRISRQLLFKFISGPIEKKEMLFSLFLTGISIWAWILLIIYIECTCIGPIMEPRRQDLINIRILNKELLPYN